MTLHALVLWLGVFLALLAVVALFEAWFVLVWPRIAAWAFDDPPQSFHRRRVLPSSGTAGLKGAGAGRTPGRLRGNTLRRVEWHS